MNNNISEIEKKLALTKVSEAELLKKIEESYPIQYLIGDVEFLNTTIKVDERVLIPRYETELLVDETIKMINNLNLFHPRILELGTGSGCIAIALKKNLTCEVTAIDISKEALDLAEENALLNNTEINFLQQDMLNTNIKNYDVLISNPPYIGKDEIVGKETKYEPQNALFAEKDGLFFYEEILKKVAKEENRFQLIAFEIGMNQGKSLINLTKKYIPNYDCQIKKDLTNRNRYAFLTKIE